MSSSLQILSSQFASWFCSKNTNPVSSVNESQRKSNVSKKEKNWEESNINGAAGNGQKNPLPRFKPIFQRARDSSRWFQAVCQLEFTREYLQLITTPGDNSVGVNDRETRFIALGVEACCRRASGQQYARRFQPRTGRSATLSLKFVNRTVKFSPTARPVLTR